MALMMPGYAFSRSRRYSRAAFEWRADDLGVLTSWGGFGLAAVTQQADVALNRGATATARYTRDRWGRLLAWPGMWPRFWSYDLDGDGVAETTALLHEINSTNLLTNSYAGTDLDGWTADASATRTRLTVLPDQSPTLFGAAVQVSVTATGNGVVVIRDTATRVPVTEGQFYGASLYLWVPAATALAGQQWVGALNWHNSGGTLLSSTTVAIGALPAGRSLVAWQGTPPAGAVSATVSLRTVGAALSPAIIVVEQAQVEQSYITSAIPADTTVGAEATRNEDRALAYTFADPIPPAVTLYAKHIPSLSGAPLLTAPILSVGRDAGTATPGGLLTLGWSYGALVVMRRIGATTVNASVTPSPTPVGAVEVLAHCSADGTLDVATRDAAGVVTSATGVTKAALHPGVVGQQWGNAVVIVGGSGDYVSHPYPGQGVGMLAAKVVPGSIGWVGIGGA